MSKFDDDIKYYENKRDEMLANYNAKLSDLRNKRSEYRKENFPRYYSKIGKKLCDSINIKDPEKELKNALNYIDTLHFAEIGKELCNRLQVEDPEKDKANILYFFNTTEMLETYLEAKKEKELQNNGTSVE